MSKICKTFDIPQATLRSVRTVTRSLQAPSTFPCPTIASTVVQLRIEVPASDLPDGLLATAGGLFDFEIELRLKTPEVRR